jgi:hypothetical protein
MKKILIIESCEKKINRDYSNSSIVHVRNSLIITDVLGADLITHESEIPLYENEDYDVIIVMYASHYTKWKKYISFLESNPEAKLFWLVNDHDLEDNVLLRKAIIELGRNYDMICNNPREGYRHWILGKKVLDKKLNDFIINWNTINLNTLIFTDEKRQFIQDTFFEKKKEGIIYFGTYRKYRSKDMLDYNDCDYTISTSKKNQIKYQRDGIDAKFINRLSWEKGKEDLFNFKYSIYFEDIHTHDNYAFMANRYYECLMTNVIMFFDHRCKATIEKSGYTIPKFLIVENGAELEAKVELLNDDPIAYNEALEIQRSNFPKIMSEKKEVIEKLIEIVNV